MAAHHYFLPHKHTHKKAKLLTWHFLVIYFLSFILLQIGFDLISLYRPGVLGVDSEITIAEVIKGTNEQRQKYGLPPLSEDNQLDEAAAAKAQNMFTENYWAHFSPSGKDPWGFINASGYKFAFAGENLARNFYTSPDVVNAWMNSPTHRDNILNPNFSEIGIAVVDGVLLGQKTTLVVQMFGKPHQSVAAVSNDNIPQVSNDLPASTAQPQFSLPQVAGSSAQSDALIDPYLVNRSLGIGLIVFLAALLILDFATLKKRRVYRLSSHYVGNISFLFIIGVALVVVTVGQIK